MPLRQAISPPVGLRGQRVFATSDEEPSLESLRATAEAAARAYYRDDYTELGHLLPPLILAAQHAVGHFDDGPERLSALARRTDVLLMAGRYLTQVRAYDLAHTALREAVADAAAAGDRTRAAAAVYLEGWMLLRQGRLDEAEALTLAAADDVEPRISRATRAELGVWGRLLLRGSSAAARNNRTREARDMLRIARSAAVALGSATATEPHSWGRFDWSSVALQAIENHMVADRPERVLALAARLPRQLTLTSNTRHRHMLDVAKARASLSQSDEALAVLTRLRTETPGWLQHQRLARDVFRTARKSRRRPLTREHRELGEYIGVRQGAAYGQQAVTPPPSGR